MKNNYVNTSDTWMCFFLSFLCLLSDLTRDKYLRH
nr:MAG TPA: hypothetical protein [Caudoviricetes sp.]